jgi:serpin B
VVSANSQFALALYQNLNAGKGARDQNIFVSPYSISTALAMTYLGSRGDTHQQMASVLHLSMPDDQLQACYAALLAQTQATPAKRYKLEVANALWGPQGVEFQSAFTDAISKYFGGGFNLMDFAHAPDASRLKINQWVEDKTAKKIRNLLHAPDITTSTRLVLTNAIYFKGDWAYKFEKEATETAPFTVRPGKIVNVPMMEHQHYFPFAEDGEMQIIEIPYAGNDLSLIAILPAGDAEKFGAALTLAKLRGLRSRMYEQKVNVFLPRFKFETRYYLEGPLTALGMPDAFDGSKADFSGMTGHRDFCIAHVIHQAMIDVNEEGSEAAAATAITMAPTAAAPRPHPTFRADHPFIFMIIHRPTDSILFMGRVSNPPPATPAAPKPR